MQTIQKNPGARTAIESGFAWDGQEAYLFDIDGTLLRSRDRVHVDSFTTTLREVMGPGVTLEGVSLAGNTDTSILREACEQAGIPAEVLEPQLATIVEAICHNVAGRKHEMQPWLMPGVEDTLKHLADRGATLGLATGFASGFALAASATGSLSGPNSLATRQRRHANWQVRKRACALWAILRETSRRRMRIGCRLLRWRRGIFHLSNSWNTSRRPARRHLRTCSKLPGGRRERVASSSRNVCSGAAPGGCGLSAGNAIACTGTNGSGA